MPDPVTHSGFKISDTDNRKFSEWREEHAKTCKMVKGYQGAIGGNWTYCFTPTSIGTVLKVECSCGERTDLSDYLSW
jgi:hypothetical protein